MKQGPQNPESSIVSAPAMKRTQTLTSLHGNKSLTRSKSQKSKMEVMVALKDEIRTDLRLMRDNIDVLLGLFADEGSENTESTVHEP